MLLATFPTKTPLKAAEKLSALLAVDKGIRSAIKSQGDGFVLITDDGKHVLFTLDKGQQ